MYASVFVLKTFIELAIPLDKDGERIVEEVVMHTIASVIALSKIIMQKYFAITLPNKEGKTLNISHHVLKISKSKKEMDLIELKKILKYSSDLILKSVKNEDKDKSHERFTKLLTTPTFYDIISEKVLEEDLDIDKIRAVDIDKMEGDTF